jgi:adsorption protein B
MGGRQIFIRPGEPGAGMVATREYFPRKFGAAVRQRTRWMTGIGLQSWELHGLLETAEHLYWFWRDRKNLVGNLISPLANLVTLYGVVRGGLPMGGGLRISLEVSLGLLAFHAAVRMACSARIYGWRFAFASPLRMVWGNWINGAATAMAIRNYVSAKLRGRPLLWLKTEHAYPNRAALVEHRRPLEEILVGSGYLTAQALTELLASKPAARSLVAHLLKMNALPEADLYEAISLEQHLPLGKPAEVSAAVTRSFPAAVARKWRVLPFKIVAGHLHVAGSEPPTEEMQEELKTFSSMEIRFQLVTPTEFAELEKEYLPAEGVPESVGGG